MVRPAASSNWKALAPLIKKGGKIPLKENAIEKESDETVIFDKKEKVWFEVDEQTLQRSIAEANAAVSPDGKPLLIADLFPKPSSESHVKDLGKYIGMDCEMVGVGPEGVQSALARVSLVNYHGEVIMDTYCRPVERITDYRTHVSGIEPRHLKGAENLASVQKQVWDLLQGKILVGHSLKNDFRVLLLEHPKRMIRDTSKFRPFRRIAGGKSPSLKRLAKEFLGIDIQGGSHDSCDDARVAMLLYRTRKKEWENYLFRGEGRVAKQQTRDRKKKKGKGVLK